MTPKRTDASTADTSAATSSPQPLFVTRPSLPPLAELQSMLEDLWSNRTLTNSGPLHRRLEQRLCSYFGIANLTLVANATLGLMLAVRHLELRGEVITTPFSFVATGHSLIWGGATPVFVDINPATLNIDPERIERAITPRTTGIMAVHCFGHACDVAAIEDIARRHGLKVIYDAAHAFGIRLDNERSILEYGDLSVVSFHATKVFNTFEGGAIISQSADSKLAVDRLTNYGIVDENNIATVGLNAKMSEVHAAMGVAQLSYVDAVIQSRRAVDERYRELLEGIAGLMPVDWPAGQSRNYYAFPVVVGDDFRCSRDELHQQLKNAGINARRYFYPLISDLPMYREHAARGDDPLEVAKDIGRRVLCLPMYPDLSDTDLKRIAQVIRHG